MTIKAEILLGGLIFIYVMAWIGVVLNIKELNNKFMRSIAIMNHSKKYLLFIASVILVLAFTVTNVSAKTFTLDYTNYSVKSTKTHKVNVSDNNWAGVNLKINKIQLIKLSKKYKYKSANDGTFNINGFIRVHYIVHTGDKDISIYPTQGTYSLSNSEQHEADSMESWDGDISSHVKKSGWVTIPVKNISDIKSVRAKFDANYESNDIDDDNQYYTYDITASF